MTKGLKSWATRRANRAAGIPPNQPRPKMDPEVRRLQLLDQVPIMNRFRNARLTASDRSEIARTAARARWGR